MAPSENNIACEGKVMTDIKEAWGKLNDLFDNGCSITRQEHEGEIFFTVSGFMDAELYENLSDKFLAEQYHVLEYQCHENDFAEMLEAIEDDLLEWNSSEDE